MWENDDQQFLTVSYSDWAQSNTPLSYYYYIFLMDFDCHYRIQKGIISDFSIVNSSLDLYSDNATQ